MIANRYKEFKKQMQMFPTQADLSVIMVIKKIFQDNKSEVSDKLKWYTDTYQLIKDDSHLLSNSELELFFDIHTKAIAAINKQEEINIDFIFKNFKTSHL